MANKILFFCLLLISSCIHPRTTFAQAYGSTPIDQLANNPKQNNGIQMMSYLIFRNPTFNSYKNFLAKEFDYIWFDQSSLVNLQADSSYKFDELFTGIRDLHTINPAAKIGVHAGGPSYMAPYHILFPYLNDSDFLHDSTGNLLKLSSDPRNNYLYTLSTYTRAKIVAAWQSIFAVNPGLSGINMDGYASRHLDAALAPGCREPNCNTRNFWINGMTSLSEEIKAGLPSDKDITYNGIIPVDSLVTDVKEGPMNEGFIRVHDGVLMEFIHVMHYSPEDFKANIDAAQSVLAQNKKVFFYSQPAVITSTNPTYSFSNDLNLERFFLATYLLIQKNPLSYFGYHPGAIYNSIPGVYFYADWNKNYGLPVSDFVALGNGLYIRNYQQGIAVVNPTDSSQTYYFPNNDWKYRPWSHDATPVESSISATIPKKTGTFYFISTTLPGDLNQDGHINLYDYNLLVAGFGTTYTIFDYNNLVGNYGK